MKYICFVARTYLVLSLVRPLALIHSFHQQSVLTIIGESCAVVATNQSWVKDAMMLRTCYMPAILWWYASMVSTAPMGILATVEIQMPVPLVGRMITLFQIVFRIKFILEKSPLGELGVCCRDTLCLPAVDSMQLT